MASPFKNYQETSITTETTVYAPSTVATIIGLSVANTSSSAVYVDIIYTDAVDGNAYLVKQAPIPVGGTLVAVGADQKVVIESGDVIKVVASDTVDVIVSTLEM